MQYDPNNRPYTSAGIAKDRQFSGSNVSPTSNTNDYNRFSPQNR